MNCKFYISLGSSKVEISKSNCIDISDMITNLDDIKLSYVRSDYGGVVRKCGSTITLTGKARNMIVSYYTENKLKSTGAFAVYRINNNWEYDLLFECPIDFSTFKYDGYTAQIACLDNSVAAILNSNKGTKYEVLVDEVKEGKQLYFDGVRLLNTVRIVFTGNSVDDESYTIRENVDCSGFVYYIPPVSYAESDIQVDGYVKMNDQEEGLSGTIDTSSSWVTAGPNLNTTSYFLEAVKDVSIEIDLKSISINVVNSVSGELNDVMVSLYKIPVNGNPVSIVSSFVNASGLCNVNLLKGERLQLCLHRFMIINPVSFGRSTFYFYNLGELRWNETGEISYIDVVKPSSLLNNLIEKMGMASYVRGEVNFDNTELDKILLVAGESVRKFNSAKLYTSFSDFCKFLEVVAGMVYVIESDGENTNIDDGSDDVDYTKDYVYDDVQIDADEFVRPGKYFTDLTNEEIDALLPDDVTLVDVVFFEDYLFGGLGNNGVYYFFNYPGIEKYNEMNSSFDIVIIDKNILYDSVSKKYYITDSVNNRLNDYFISSLDFSRYNHLARFGGFIIGNIFDSGEYDGDVNRENIFFSKELSKFLYYQSGSYYSVFEDSESYQKDGRLNPSAVFVDISDLSSYDDGTSYISTSGNRLLMYNGPVPSLPERNDGEDTPVVIPTDRYVIKFVHRNSVFLNSVSKTLSVVSEPEYSVSSGRIYSSVKVGYAKQDYDLGNNGKDEFNSTIEYSTGLNLKEQTLDFLCPYRADSYGFQELSKKNVNQTSDSDSDNNTFIVYTSIADSCYKLDRSISVDGVYTETIFNARLFPHFLIDANERFLASYTSRLIYTSSDILDNIMINSNRVNKNVSLASQLFKEGDITVKTNDFILPEDWNGYVDFEWDGKLYKGYLKNLDINVCNDEVFEYELIEC